MLRAGVVGICMTRYKTAELHFQPRQAGFRELDAIALAWTCVTCLGTGEEFCTAHLPVDVNGDGASDPADVLRLIDCLNGFATCEIHQCDVDRSGVCGSPDILRVIDLLNGAGVYEPWLNRTLTRCPSAP